MHIKVFILFGAYILKLNRRQTISEWLDKFINFFYVKLKLKPKSSDFKLVSSLEFLKD